MTAPATLGEALRAAARAAPRQPALVDPAETLCWAELAERVAAVAAGLAAIAATDGPRAHALALRPGRDDVIALLAHGMAGIPLLPLHPALPEAEAARLSEAAGAGRLTVEDVLDGARPAAAAPSPPRPDDVALLVATSGSSGEPKLARLPHRAVLAAARALNLRLPFGPNDRWILTLPLSHVGGLSVIVRCLLARKAMVLVPRFSEAAVLEAIANCGGTRLSAVPAIADRLIAAGRGDTLRRLGLMMLGGQAASPALRRALAEAGVPAVASYGLTESCAAATCESPAEAWRPGSGFALDGVAIAIADDDGRPLPAGTPGRILLGSEALFAGYLGRPDLAPRDHAGRFDTGDIGVLDDSGRLHVEGRRAELIVTGGEKVAPGTVEAVLREHPLVREAVVFGLPDPRWGAIVSAAVEGPLALADDSALAALLDARLAPWARPRRLAVVATLPRLANGKVDRLAVPGLAAPGLQPFPRR
jgi:O-succinylbenzoic acid--CoA ligase